MPTSGKVVLGTFAAVRVGRPSAAPAESFYLSDDKWAAQARAGSSPRLDGNNMSAGATAPRECCSPRAQAQVDKVSAALAAATVTASKSTDTSVGTSAVSGTVKTDGVPVDRIAGSVGRAGWRR